jgi:hypothetical protein
MTGMGEAHFWVSVAEFPAQKTFSHFLKFQSLPYFE